MLRIEKYIENIFMNAVNKLYPEKDLKPIELSLIHI